MFMEQIRAIDHRIRQLEGNIKSLDSVNTGGRSVAQERCLQSPDTEEDLKEFRRLPDDVKELRNFDGSWVRSVETILRDYEIVIQKLIYRSEGQSIRQIIIGAADTALISYNVFDSNWDEIRKVLSLHFVDKRAIQTLWHHLNQLSQRPSTVDEFYSTVNRQLSLIINKLKTESHITETMTALVETYRNRSLDIFIRGLK